MKGTGFNNIVRCSFLLIFGPDFISLFVWFVCLTFAGGVEKTLSLV